VFRQLDGGGARGAGRSARPLRRAGRRRRGVRSNGQRRLRRTNDLHELNFYATTTLALTVIETGRLRSRDTLWQRIGRLKAMCSRVARTYEITVAADGSSLALFWRKDQAKAAYMRHAEGAYLLRTNLTGNSKQELWHMYMQLK